MTTKDAKRAVRLVERVLRWKRVRHFSEVGEGKFYTNLRTGSILIHDGAARVRWWDPSREDRDAMLLARSIPGMRLVRCNPPRSRQPKGAGWRAAFGLPREFAYGETPARAIFEAAWRWQVEREVSGAE